jgi:hypothetical protein
MYRLQDWVDNDDDLDASLTDDEDAESLGHFDFVTRMWCAPR